MALCRLEAVPLKIVQLSSQITIGAFPVQVPLQIASQNPFFSNFLLLFLFFIFGGDFIFIFLKKFGKIFVTED